ncbi:MAG: hypothetical protein IJ155_02740 [Prevotella sp.]|nr:hypothetical protein [Prevotella sp.]
MGTLSKFWNTNARPEGWMGRLALRMMNLTHTPMALWNLSLIDFQPDWTILDVGCGGGKNIARIEAMRILPTDEISQLLTDAGFNDLQIARKGGYTINFRVKKAL